jgi:raffinose/stachyose/melibiose transport system permease protein
MYPFGKGLKRHLPLALLMIPLGLYVLLGVYPSMMTVIYSFTNIKLGYGNEVWHFAGLTQYKRILFSSNSHEYLDGVWRTVKFAIEVTLIQNAIALFIAIILNKKLRGDVFYRSVFFLPVVLGVAISGLMWLLIFNPMGGFANEFLHFFGAKSSGFLSDRKIALQLVIAVQIWVFMGYSMLIFLSGLQAIPKDLYESASMDGTTQWQAFRFITFPLIAPAFTVNILLSLIGALQTFDTIIILTNGQFDTQTIAYKVYGAAFNAGSGKSIDQGLASGLAMIQFVLVFVVVIFMQYYLRKREVQA